MNLTARGHLDDASSSSPPTSSTLDCVKWEYLLVRWTVTREGAPVVFEIDGAGVDPAPLVERLRAFGDQGWEVAGVGDDAGHTLFFKRRTP